MVVNVPQQTRRRCGNRDAAEVVVGQRRMTRVAREQNFLALKLPSCHFDGIFANASLFHVPCRELPRVLSELCTALKPDGVLIFEDPYLGDIVEKTSYDQIYDEHAFYFSAASVSYLFEQYGMEVIDVIPQNVHGGSMRYVIAHKGKKQISAAVAIRSVKQMVSSLVEPGLILAGHFATNGIRCPPSKMSALCPLKT